MLHRKEVVELARSYVDTRFVHQGRTRTITANGRKVGGVDCAGLVIVVGHECGLLPQDVDVPAYHRVPDGRTIRAMLAKYAVEIPFGEVQPGDIACLKWERSRFPQHMGIFSQLCDGRLGMIHSYFELGRVVESGFDDSWLSRLVSAHAWPAVEG
jgi:cell wall-associated NlpC family hydrolase